MSADFSIAGASAPLLAPMEEPEPEPGRFVLEQEQFQHLWRLLESAEQLLPNTTDADAAQAVLRATKDFLVKLDAVPPSARAAAPAHTRTERGDRDKRQDAIERGWEIAGLARIALTAIDGDDGSHEAEIDSAVRGVLARVGELGGQVTALLYDSIDQIGWAPRATAA